MEFIKEKLPIRITPCPISEAVVELRYESKLPSQVVAGIIYNKFQDKFKNPKMLPINELPAIIRDNDPSLRYSPHLKISDKDFTIQFGPRSFSVAYTGDYLGWSKFQSIISESFEKLKQLNLIKKPERIGLRYITFFEGIDIFNFLNIEMRLSDNNLVGNSNVLRTEFSYEDYTCIVIAANKTNFNTKSGSSIDIDIVYNKLDLTLDKYNETINKAHEIEKKIFFNLIKDDFLNKNYKPEY